MPTAKEIKGRIDSVKNVRQITKTMKAVASAKLSRAKETIEQSRPYSKSIESLIQSILRRHSDIDHSFLTSTGDDGKQFVDDQPLYLVLTGDRGLCGAFNSNVQRRVDTILDNHENAQLHVVGKQGLAYFEHQEAPVEKSYVDFWDEFGYGEARMITDHLIDEFELSDTSSVTLVYNEFETAMTQKVVEYPLLPLDRDDFAADQESSEDVSEQIDFLYEPDARQIINRLFPRHVRTQVYTALLESDASEQGARMVAMDNATENANEMIDDLTLDYNQIRQATITQEIAEIVGGAEALKE